MNVQQNLFPEYDMPNTIMAIKLPQVNIGAVKELIYDDFGYCKGAIHHTKGIKILVCEKRQADEIIIKHHYSKKPTKNSFLSFLVYYNGKISGAMQLGYGIRPKIKTGMNSDEVREFDRMWLSDDMPKFSETITLSLLHKFLQKAYPQIKTLISYADTSAGNKGTIYKAANYKLVAELKADFYILANGERVHPVSMWHRHKTRAWNVMIELYPGIKKADGKQLKFIYNL